MKTNQLETSNQPNEAITFLLAEHGQAGWQTVAGKLRGDEISHTTWDSGESCYGGRINPPQNVRTTWSSNRLTDLGEQQIRGSVLALQAMGIQPSSVSSAVSTRTVESAELFVESWDTGSKLPLLGTIPDIQDVRGALNRWKNDKPDKKARLGILPGDEMTAKRKDRAMSGGTDVHAGWSVPLDEREEGERPVDAALRGIKAIESHAPEPGELIFSHGFLNHLMLAVAQRVSAADRQSLIDWRPSQKLSSSEDLLVRQTMRRELQLLGVDWNPPKELDLSQVGKTILWSAMLRDVGLPDFDSIGGFEDHRVNGKWEKANITEVTILPDGKWLVGRRILPLVAEVPPSAREIAAQQEALERLRRWTAEHGPRISRDHTPGDGTYTW